MGGIVAKHPVQAQTEKICENLAEILLQARADAGLSQRKVSASGGPSTQMVGYVEKRERLPKIDVYIRHGLALGLLPSELLARAEQRAGLQKPAPGDPEPGDGSFPTGK